MDSLSIGIGSALLSLGLIPVVLNEIFFYPTPNNFNYLYCIGFLLGLILVIQLISGILLTCY